MLDFILFLHGRNVYLIILAGTITAIWGFILFARTKTLGESITTMQKKLDAPAAKASIPDAGDASTSTTNQSDTDDVLAASNNTGVVATKDGDKAIETKDMIVDTLAHEKSTFKAITKSWRIALIVTVVLALLQGVFGIIMVALGQKPGPAGASLYYLHYVYGGIAALVVPVATTYVTNGKNPRRDLLIYSLAALILTAAAVRAWMTGPAVFTLLP